MLEKTARAITAFSIQNGVVSADDEDVYIYGWSLFLSTLGSTLLMLVIGLVTGEFIGTCLYILCFCSLRVTAGGYHANSYGSCFLWTFIWYGTAFCVSFFLPEGWCLYATIALLLISVLITVTCAPVDHPNKPISDKRKKIFKKRSCIIVSLQAVIIILIMILISETSYHYMLWAALGGGITSLTLLFVKIFKPYEKGELK